MTTDQDNKERYFKAKKKLHNIKMFYIHLAGYIVVVALLLFNIYILEESNPYTEFFMWFNSIMIVAWTIFIILHGRWALKGKTFFNKNWEEKKLKEFLDNENKNKTTWE